MKHSLLAALLAATVSLAAHATLGGTVNSVAQDGLQFHAQVRTVLRPAFTMHEMRSDKGITVREYADKQGAVFAVTWSGPWRPDMQQLLGSYFGSFKHEPETSNRRIIGRHPIDIQRDDLVIRSEGHMRAFSGYAYLPQKLPAGVTPADLQ